MLQNAGAEICLIRRCCAAAGLGGARQQLSRKVEADNFEVWTWFWKLIPQAPKRFAVPKARTCDGTRVRKASRRGRQNGLSTRGTLVARQSSFDGAAPAEPISRGSREVWSLVRNWSNTGRGTAYPVLGSKRAKQERARDSREGESA